MTHTNHRQGTPADLGRDYVIMIMPAKGFNDDEKAPGKLREALKVFLDNGAVNAGAIKGGFLVRNSPAEMEATISDDTPMYHGVFTKESDVESALRALKEKDLGLSIVVSGVIPRIQDIAGRVGIRPHSIEFSLGVMGKRDYLHDDHIIPLTTMCGHGLIPEGLAKHVVEEVSAGRMSSEQGARRLGECCVCGIFNTERAKSLIEEAARLSTGGSR